MLDVRPVLQILGWLLIGLAATMLIPAAADLIAGSAEWTVFALCSGLTLFVGLALEVGMRSDWRRLTVRQTYSATAAGWLIPCAFAALPFAFGQPQLDASDALFEATAGLTTTASTVLTGLNTLPPGLLLWRGLLQWLGGAGTLAMAVAVLPMLRIGGMQVFRIEMTMGGDRATPRAIRLITLLAVIYAGLTVMVGGALWLAGMPGFDALVHAMATVSTGGVSTWDGSFGHFDSPAIDLVGTLGMVAGGMPFLVFAQMAKGDVRAPLRDSQLRWYGIILLGSMLTVTLWLVLDRHEDGLSALRHGAFAAASALTGTGFASTDSAGWGGLPSALLLFGALLGGCAGSTSGGIKIFRLELLLTGALAQLRRLLRPHAVLTPRFNRRPIPEEILASVMGFLFIYALAFAVLAMGLGLLGLDFVSAVSAAIGALTNFGPGLGPLVGPSGGFAQLAEPAKWLLTLGMVFGRLEMLPLLVLFIPAFWKQ